MCKVVDVNCRELVHAPSGSHHVASDLKNNLLPLEKIFEDVNRIFSPQPNPTEEQPTSDSGPQLAHGESPNNRASSVADSGSERAAVATNMEVDSATESKPQKESDKLMQVDLSPAEEKPEPSAHVPASEDPCLGQPECTPLPEKTSIYEMEVEASKDTAAPEEHNGEGKSGVIVLDD